MKAGAHLILAHSPDCYVTHAREAVRHYKDLYTETETQLRWKGQRVAVAERVLEKAEQDAKDLAENPLTEEEYEEQMREFSDAMDEQMDAWKKFELEGGSEESDDEKEQEGAGSSGTRHSDGSSGTHSGGSTVEDAVEGPESQPMASESQATAATSFGLEPTPETEE